VLGRTGINVMTRLMGLILAAMAVELLADGLVKLFPVLAAEGQRLPNIQSAHLAAAGWRRKGLPAAWTGVRGDDRQSVHQAASSIKNGGFPCGKTAQEGAAQRRLFCGRGVWTKRFGG
jgi:hypothetical protein